MRFIQTNCESVCCIETHHRSILSYDTVFMHAYIRAFIVSVLFPSTGTGPAAGFMWLQRKAGRRVSGGGNGGDGDGETMWVWVYMCKAQERRNALTFNR